MPKRSSSQEPGTHIAGLISSVVTDAMVKARAGILPQEMVEKWRHNKEFMETCEKEAAPLFTTMFAPLLDQPNLSPATRAFIEQGSKPTHQVDFILQILGFMGAALSLLPALGQIESRQAVYDLNTYTQNVPLSPADAADAVMRNIIDNETGQAMAAMAGIPSENFGAMVQLIGEPPGLEELLALWRRGDIEWPTFENAALYSRVGDQFINFYQSIAQNYMSPADVIELAIKGVAGADDYETMFMKAGGYEGQYEPLFQAAGDAIGNEQVLGLYDQGLAEYSDVLATFGRSRMNPMFYGLAFQLRHKFLQPFQIGELVTADPGLAPEAMTWLQNLGYGADQAAALIAAKSKGRTATTHTETASMITALYEDAMMTSVEAQDALDNLGYTPGESALILQLADAKRERSQLAGAISAVRTAVVANKITQGSASMDLDALGIPPAARDQWLQAWEIERSAKVKELTPAQINKMVGDQLLTPAEGVARFVNMGYGQNDAELLAGTWGWGPLIDPATGLPYNYVAPKP